MTVISDLGQYKKSARYSSFIVNKAGGLSSIPFDEGYVNGYQPVAYIDSMSKSVLLSSEEFKIKKSSGRQCCLFKRLQQDNGHLCSPDQPDKADKFLKLLKVVPMDDFVTLCKPFIELTAYASVLDAIGHKFQWEQTYGSDVHWLTATNQLTVAFEYIGPRQEKRFRLTIDKDTEVEQIFDVKVFSTPHDMPISEVNMESSPTGHLLDNHGGAEVFPLTSTIPFAPAIDGYNTSTPTQVLLKIDKPTYQDYLYQYNIIERSGQSITNLGAIPVSGSTVFGPVSINSKYRVNSIYRYPQYDIEYRSPESIFSNSGSRLVVNSNSYSSNILLGSATSVVTSIPELIAFQTNDTVDTASVSLTAGEFNLTVYEYLLLSLTFPTDEMQTSSVAIQKGTYSATFYDIGGGTIGGI